MEELKRQMLELLQQKKDGMRVDNRLHRTAVELARQKLDQRFPSLRWETVGGNEKGLNVQGFLGRH